MKMILEKLCLDREKRLRLGESSCTDEENPMQKENTNNNSIGSTVLKAK